jgi:hypothetical protein
MDDPGGRWALASDQPLRDLPGRRGASVAVPGRGGVMIPRRTVADATSFGISLIVMGAVPGKRVTDMNRSLSALEHLFTNNGELVTVKYVTGPDQRDVRVAWCRLVAGTTPDAVGNGDAAKVTYVLEIPSGEWRAENQLDATHIPTDTYSYFDLLGLRGSVREVTDAVFMVKGPFKHFRITQVGYGQFVEMVRNTNSAEVIRLDLGKFTATVLGQPDFEAPDAAGIDVTPLVKNGGAGAGTHWLPLLPKAIPGIGGNDPMGRGVNIQFFCSGRGSATRLYSRTRGSY